MTRRTTRPPALARILASSGFGSDTAIVSPLSSMHERHREVAAAHRLGQRSIASGVGVCWDRSTSGMSSCVDRALARSRSPTAPSSTRSVPIRLPDDGLLEQCLGELVVGDQLGADEKLAQVHAGTRGLAPNWRLRTCGLAASEDGVSPIVESLRSFIPTPIRGLRVQTAGAIGPWSQAETGATWHQPPDPEQYRASKAALSRDFPCAERPWRRCSVVGKSSRNHSEAHPGGRGSHPRLWTPNDSSTVVTRGCIPRIVRMLTRCWCAGERCASGWVEPRRERYQGLELVSEGCSKSGIGCQNERNVAISPHSVWPSSLEGSGGRGCSSRPARFRTKRAASRRTSRH